MKRIIFLLALSTSVIICEAQNKKDLQKQIEILKKENAVLQLQSSQKDSIIQVRDVQISKIKSLISDVENILSEQVARNNSSANSSKTSVESTKHTPAPSTPSRTIHTGPRGGSYYINSNGNKTYVKKK